MKRPKGGYETIMSSHYATGADSRLGVYATIIVAVLLILMLCAMFLRDDSTDGSRGGPMNRAARTVNEVM